MLPARIGWLARLLNLLPDALHDQLLLGQPRKPRVGEAGATAILNGSDIKKEWAAR